MRQAPPEKESVPRVDEPPPFPREIPAGEFDALAFDEDDQPRRLDCLDTRGYAEGKTRAVGVGEFLRSDTMARRKDWAGPAPAPCYRFRMHRRLVSSGSPFERDIAYSRAVVVGDRVLVSGTTGFDYASMTISDDVAEQAAQCLRNVESALAKAGASMADVVRVRYILPNAADFPATWPALRAAFGEIRPAATMFEARLADPRMKIEIEVDAIIGSA